MSRLALLGLTSGTFSSLVGLGGSFLMIPGLTSKTLMGTKQFLTQHEAQATALAVISFSSLVAGGSYLVVGDPQPRGGEEEQKTSSTKDELDLQQTNKRNILLTDAACISLGGLLTARFGVSLASRLNGKTLKKMLSVFMILVGPTVPLRGMMEDWVDSGSSNSHNIITNPSSNIPKPINPNLKTHLSKSLPQKNNVNTTPSPPPYKRPMQMMSLGLGSGFMAGLFGVGGGAILVPLLCIIGAPANLDSPPPPIESMTMNNIASATTTTTEQNVNYSYKDILTTSLLAISPPALLATYTSRKLILPKTAITLILFSSAGAGLTATFVAKLEGESKRRGEEVLRWGFCGVMGGFAGQGAEGACPWVAHSEVGRLVDCGCAR